MKRFSSAAMVLFLMVVMVALAFAGIAGITTNVAPASAGRQGKLFVFAKTTDGHIHFNQAAPGGAFVGWREIPGGITTDAAVAAGMQGTTLFVFAKRTDGRILYNQAAQGGAFVGWQE